MSSNSPQNLLAGWHVLILDDEPDSLFVARRLLQMHGATVMTASDGRQGLTLIREHGQALDFVVCDLSMPVLDGWEFIAAVRDDDALADLPVIALTAHAMEGDREKALAAGFHNYLTKPLNPETFVTDLLDLLRDIPSIAARLGEK